MRSQQQFVAEAAHELRTPLTSLRGEIEVALRRERSSQDYQHVLRSNLEEVTRLVRLTNNLLLLAQADAGESITDSALVDVSEICRRVCGAFKPLAQQKGIQLIVDCNEPVVTAGDSSGIERIVSNLVENAIKYTPNGEKVAVSVSQTHDRVRLMVSDTGIGIPHDESSQVFERFYQIDKARDRGLLGAGLGLAIVKTIVEAHGGTVEVTSEPGTGSTFTVWLPSPTLSPNAQKLESSAPQTQHQSEEACASHCLRRAAGEQRREARKA